MLHYEAMLTNLRLVDSLARPKIRADTRGAPGYGEFFDVFRGGLEVSCESIRASVYKSTAYQYLVPKVEHRCLFLLGRQVGTALLFLL